MGWAPGCCQAVAGQNCRNTNPSIISISSSNGSISISSRSSISNASIVSISSTGAPRAGTATLSFRPVGDYSVGGRSANDKLVRRYGSLFLFFSFFSASQKRLYLSFPLPLPLSLSRAVRFPLSTSMLTCANDV